MEHRKHYIVNSEIPLTLYIDYFKTELMILKNKMLYSLVITKMKYLKIISLSLRLLSFFTFLNNCINVSYDYPKWRDFLKMLKYKN